MNFLKYRQYLILVTGKRPYKKKFGHIDEKCSGKLHLWSTVAEFRPEYLSK